MIDSVLTVRNLGSWFDSRLSKSKHITKICGFFIFLFVQQTTHQELSLTNINRDTHSLCSFNEHKFCHTTPLIVELHWLPIRFRIVYFKILLITFKILHGLAPSYLLSLISFRRPPRFNLRSSNDNLLLYYPLAPGGGTLGISGWGCAAGTLEPLTYTRASSAKFCYPILE